MTRRLASLLLFLLLVGSLEPFASAAFSSAVCCCPDGATACPVRERSCALQSGCGSDRDATSVPLTLFLLPADAIPPSLASVEDFKIKLALLPVSQVVPVPHPPPRA